MTVKLLPIRREATGRRETTRCPPNAEALWFTVFMGSKWIEESLSPQASIPQYMINRCYIRRGGEDKRAQFNITFRLPRVSRPPHFHSSPHFRSLTTRREQTIVYWERRNWSSTSSRPSSSRTGPHRPPGTRPTRRRLTSMRPPTHGRRSRRRRSRSDFLGAPPASRVHVGADSPWWQVTCRWSVRVRVPIRCVR